MGTIAQALATALQLTVAEPAEIQQPDSRGFFSPLVQTEPQAVEPSTYEQAITIEESIQAQLDASTPEVRRALEWRLSKISNNLTYDVDADRDAEAIQNILPQINDIIAGLDYGAKIVVEGETYSDIHQLQNTLGTTSDGVLGPNTVSTLLEHLAVNEKYTSLDGLPDLRNALERLAPEEFRNFDTLANHAADIAEIEANHAEELTGRDTVIAEQNQFIADTFEECVGRDVIDLSKEDPFGDIVQNITDAYADDEDEISLASEQVAGAIKDICGNKLSLLPEAMQVSIITSFIEQFQQPLESEVNHRIQDARNLNESTIAGNAFVLGQRSIEDSSSRTAPAINDGPS